MPPRNENPSPARAGAPHPTSRSAFWLAAGLALVALATGPAPAFAASITVDLSVELDSGDVGSYGHVHIEENGGDLDFSIQLTDELGDDADLHEFYFSLVGSFSNLQLSDTNAPNTPYTLESDPSVAGGAGTRFDYGVNFGNGGGGPGNGTLCCASFSLSADEALTIADLLVTTFASGSTIAVDLAAHVQGTSFDPNADSETVAGVFPPPDPIPEPGTGPLLAASLIALTAYRRSRRA